MKCQEPNHSVVPYRRLYKCAFVVSFPWHTPDTGSLRGYPGQCCSHLTRYSDGSALQKAEMRTQVGKEVSTNLQAVYSLVLM